MAMTNFGLLFLMSMLMGGVSDLLDVIPTSEYWRIKNVQVNPEVVATELAPPPAAGDISKLIDELGAADPNARETAANKIRAMGLGVIAQLQKATDADNPEIAARARRLINDIQNGGKAQQVRKLMAIRTAGEQKMKDLLPRLKELEKSEEMFVGEYASAAVAAIEGKPYTRPTARSGEDVWKLPSDVRAVFHLSMQGSKVATVEDFANIPSFGPAPADPAEKKQMLDQAMRHIVDVADQVGNVRIEGVTVGLSGDVGNNSGYVVFMIDGQYDRVAVANLLGKLTQGKSRAVAGIDVIDFNPEFGALFPSNQQMVLLGGPRESKKPFEAVAEAFKGNRQPLKQSPELTKLLENLDLKQPMWGAMHVTDAYRQAPLFRSMEWLTLSGTTKGNVLDFRFNAKGQNEAGMKEAVAMTTTGLADARTAFKQFAQNPPMEGMKEPMAIALKLVESMEVKTDPADGTKATLTGQLDAPAQTLLGSFFGMVMGGRSEVHPPQPDVLEEGQPIPAELRPQLQPVPVPD